MIQQKIGFLGAGTMAEALIRGLIETKNCTSKKIVASDINEIRLAHMAKTYSIETTADNVAVTRQCSVLILAVKPQQLNALLEEIRGELDCERHILISIVAGITTGFIEKKNECRLKVVRVMPNTPARLQAGASAFCLGQQAAESEALLTHRLFESVGLVVRVDEKLMDAVTALSGSGPAYVFNMCEMMTATGIQMGIPAYEAEQLAIQTIFGAARMLKESGQNAGDLRKAVTSPGGTTQAAFDYLAATNFELSFQNALLAARDHGKKLNSSSEKGSTEK